MGERIWLFYWKLVLVFASVVMVVSMLQLRDHLQEQSQGVGAARSEARTRPLDAPGQK